MAINTEVLLLTTDLILIIMVIYLLDRLRKLKKNVESDKGKQPPETAVPLEAKPDLSVAKIEVQEKTEPKLENEKIVAASTANPEPAPKKDELEDRLLEELHAIPSEVKLEAGTAEPGTLKLEDEPPGENPADTEPGDAKSGKVRKPRKKRSKSKKADGTGEAASGKKAGRKKKTAEPAGQIVETKPAQEIVNEEKVEAFVKEEKPEGIMEEEKPEELKEPQKDTLF